MAFSTLGLSVFLLLIGVMLVASVHQDGGTHDQISFVQNYKAVVSNGHVLSLNQGREIQLLMNKSSGGAGFESKLSYGTGFFHMKIKLPGSNSAGVVTAFYLTSSGTNAHDELDFEFLGNVEGQPITLQTNVFANGQGNREQRIHLWFDPSADFHDYQILWNHHQIVYFVDNIPIRVFRNNKKIGVPYPSQPMKITASLWDGDDWATNGGQTKVNWTYAPFKANFQGFDINGCSPQNSIKECYASKYWWNNWKLWKLDSKQQAAYENVRKNYINYDYCSDKGRFHTPPKECASNS